MHVLVPVADSNEYPFARSAALSWHGKLNKISGGLFSFPSCLVLISTNLQLNGKSSKIDIQIILRMSLIG